MSAPRHKKLRKRRGARMRIRHRRWPIDRAVPPPPRAWPWPLALLAGVLSLIAAMVGGLLRREVVTAIFALARTVGWIAQLNEMIGDPEYKIGRPRQLFTGSVRRDVVPIAQR